MLTSRESTYLKNIYEHSIEGEIPVKLTSISKAMNVKPQTCLEAIRKLERKGYLRYIPRTGIILTEKGEKEGYLICRRHRILETALVSLGVPLDEACSLSSKLENVITDEAVDRICSKLGHPR